MKNKRCPKCNYDKSWKVRRGRLKRVQCGYEWIANKSATRFCWVQWRKVLRYFVLGPSSNKTAFEAGIEKRRVLRALNRTRGLMLTDIPGGFEGIVKVDVTYLGGQ